MGGSGILWDCFGENLIYYSCMCAGTIVMRLWFEIEEMLTEQCCIIGMVVEWSHPGEPVVILWLDVDEIPAAWPRWRTPCSSCGDPMQLLSQKGVDSLRGSWAVVNKNRKQQSKCWNRDRRCYTSRKGRLSVWLKVLKLQQLHFGCLGAEK